MSFLLKVGTAAALCCMATASTAATYALTTQQDSGQFPIVTGDDAGETSSLASANANKYNTTDSAQAVSLLFTAQIYIQGAEDGSGASPTEFRAFCVEIDQGLGIPALQSGDTTLYDRNATHLDATRRDKLATLFFNEYDPDGSIDHQAPSNWPFGNWFIRTWQRCRL